MTTWRGDLAVVPADAHCSFRDRYVALMGSFKDRPAVLRRVADAGGRYHPAIHNSGHDPATQVVVVGSRPDSATPAGNDPVLQVAREKQQRQWQADALQLQRWMAAHPEALVVDESFAVMGNSDVSDKLIVGLPKLESSPLRERALVADHAWHVGRVPGPEPPPGRGLSPSSFDDVNRVGRSRTIAAADAQSAFLLLFVGINGSRPAGVTEAEVLSAVAPILHPHSVRRVVSAVILRERMDELVREAVASEGGTTPVGEDISPQRARVNARAAAIAKSSDPLLKLCYWSAWRNPVAVLQLDMPHSLVVEADADQQSFPFRDGVPMRYRWEIDAETCAPPTVT
eukprot:TRINITY_DN10994_c0_g1_i1.p1 TRINITY_DN10994_c0_g1~~TRINITY_DN10994_c0_g1_i1.p1  ORF type:complete len:364 (+),score=100.36 TRINITY_DN10994_c0_g1_i1:69-1094(+)